jgi:hypothetical protein
MRTSSRPRIGVIVPAVFAFLLVADAARAQFGGMVSGMGGGMRGMGQKMGEGQSGGDQESVRPVPIHLHPPHPLSASAARTWLKLQQTVAIPFEKEATLDQVVSFVQETTQGKKGEHSGDEGIPVYVDPVALQEAEKTMDSPVTFRTKGLPLATSLELMLKQLALHYYVRRDGLVTITSRSAEEESPELAIPVTAAAARTWVKLHEPIAIHCEEDTPLADLLKRIKAATKGEGFPTGVPVYVDPIGLQEAEKSMESTVRLDLEGIPLATSLDLITKQLGLTYRVQDDGIVIIEGEPEEDETLPPGHGAETLAHLKYRLEQVRLEAEIAKFRAMAEAPQAGLGGGMRSRRPR